jgi:putative oxidoreductase
MQLDRLFRTDDSARQLILRFAVAAVMFPHGAQKLFAWFGGPGYAATMHAFESTGIPSIFAFLAIVAEALGSLGLLFGLLTRVAALGIIAVMLVAIASVHVHIGWFMNWTGTQKGEGFEFHVLVIAMALVLAVWGGGKYSLDATLFRWIEEREKRRVRPPVEARV